MAIALSKPIVASMPEENIPERIRVLAIDDNETCRNLFKDLLEPQGFEVVGIANPVKAIERFKTERATYQLVLLDYFMPELDGAETFKWLKQLKPSIKVILVSGAEELHLRRILAQNQFDGCIRKPFNLHEALQIIRNVMSNEKQGLSIGL
jgi:two-component system cell cycle sensor histidine kinase/response regulator CckA